MRTELTNGSNDKKRRVEAYLEWLDLIAGDNGKIYNIDNSNPTLQLFVVKFDGVPNSGYSTTYSYGLSSIHHREWTNSAPELVICVNSVEISWGLAMGDIIRQKRHQCLFEYGSVINFNEKIANDSEMSAFVIFANCLYEPGDEVLHLSDESIGLSQLYPIHYEEIDVISRIGIEAFMVRSRIDFCDVSRSPYLG